MIKARHGLEVRYQTSLRHRRAKLSLLLLALICLSFPTIDPQLAVFAQTPPPSFVPQAALARLQTERGNVQVRIDEASGAVRFLAGDLLHGAPQTPEATARAFFAHYADLFGLISPAMELETSDIDDDGHGYRSVRFQQRYRNVIVLGSDIRAEIDPQGTLQRVHGRLLPYPHPASVTPRISATTASQHASSTIGRHGSLQQPAQLVIIRQNGLDTLAWQFFISTNEPARWAIVVDASTGTTLQRQNILADALERYTYSADSDLFRAEGDPPTGDKPLDAAHDFAGSVYIYFQRQHGRDSLDGHGIPIRSVVHYGSDYNNAFWNGQEVVYGDGDGILFSPLSEALDVAAHELTHGITEHSAGLLYSGEPGALNEAYSDIFAALIDTANWDIAERVYTPSIPGDALRSLADPTRYGQPSVLGEYVDTSDNNRFVHLNSGIFAHVAYSIALQIGRTKVGHIFYRTLTMKLTQNSNFADARDLTIAACNELIGRFAIGISDCRTVRIAFADAGMGSAYDPTPFQVFLPQVATPSSCNPNRIRNGSFEEGQVAWPNTGLIIGNWGVAQTGVSSAKLDNNDQLLQLVQLPSGTKQVMLSFALQRQSNSDPTELQVTLEDPTTRMPIGSPLYAGKDLQADTWRVFTFSIAQLSGHEAFRLVFRPANGANSLYLDRVGVNIRCT